MVLTFSRNCSREMDSLFPAMRIPVSFASIPKFLNSGCVSVRRSWLLYPVATFVMPP